MIKQVFADDEQFARAKILIIDDEQVNIRVLEWALRQAKFSNLQGLTEPLKARDEFIRFKPDIILLDLNMPDLDGFGVLEQLRLASQENDFVPVLVLTGENSVETRVRALAAGADDFLSKPLDYTEVTLRIKNLLRTRFLHQHTRELEAQIAALKKSR